MTAMLDSALLELIAWRSPQPNFLEPTANLSSILSAEDGISFHALERILYYEDFKPDSFQHQVTVSDAFASPLYSDACKSYFAAAHLSDEQVLSAADKFLTEGIIFSYLDGPKSKFFKPSYFAALIRSKHLSERIILAAGHKMDSSMTFNSMNLIPDSMVTPGVVNSWLDKATFPLIGFCVSDLFSKAAILRVKQVYPEYQEFPDEWALKVFCGRTG